MRSLSLPDGLSIRPAGPADHEFLESLYRSTRGDLFYADAERDFIESIIDQQFEAQTIGYGNQFPDAMYFVVEKLSDRIGRVTIDFEPHEIHLIDIAFIPKARGHGYGKGIMIALQEAASQSGAPLSLTVHNANLPAKNLYAKLGFQVEDSRSPYQRMVWYPGKSTIITA